MKDNINVKENSGIKLKEVRKENLAADIKERAMEALQNSDMSKVLEVIGLDENKNEANAAMKEVLAKKFAEYAITAIKEAKKRNMKLGAAAIIIAANSKQ